MTLNLPDIQPKGTHRIMDDKMRCSKGIISYKQCEDVSIPSFQRPIGHSKEDLRLYKGNQY